jgi:hypothetical protein
LQRSHLRTRTLQRITELGEILHQKRSRLRQRIE